MTTRYHQIFEDYGPAHGIRGHIREYKPGLYTWVQPHVVGTNKDGIVTKDYKLEAPL